MYKIVPKLILYSNIDHNSILFKLCDAIRDFDYNKISKEEIIGHIYRQIKRLLDISTDYAFNGNLWHNYITFLIISNENSFSLVCEGVGAIKGASVNTFAENDFKIFKTLFEYDFSKIEKALDINCFSLIENYTAINKRQKMYNRDISEAVKILSDQIAKSKNTKEIFTVITDFYQHRGVGNFGINRAFRIIGSGTNIKFLTISNADSVKLNDLIGYENQKKELCTNTESFCKGNKSNNVLLYGDAGTGKSTCIKAMVNEYYEKGLRMIEIYKHQFKDLSNIIAKIKKRNYKFIIFIDDLSFEEDEVEYKFLKAVIEGGVESRPDNVLIYATSNRRHLIKETWSDRRDMEFNDEIHRSDTIEEKLSLSSRFGISINFSIPTREEFFQIVRTLAKNEGITIEDDKLLFEANKWEIRHGGISGRCARQFIDNLKSKNVVQK